MRVVIADDELLIREGLSRLLSEIGFEVVATAAAADDALRKVRAHEPDVLVTDIRMLRDWPTRDCRRPRRSTPPTRRSAWSSWGYVVVACLGYSRAGAGALIFTKQTPRNCWLAWQPSNSRLAGDENSPAHAEARPGHDHRVRPGRPHP